MGCPLVQKGEPCHPRWVLGSQVPRGEQLASDFPLRNGGPGGVRRRNALKVTPEGREDREERRQGRRGVGGKAGGLAVGTDRGGFASPGRTVGGLRWRRFLGDMADVSWGHRCVDGATAAPRYQGGSRAPSAAPGPGPSR